MAKMYYFLSIGFVWIKREYTQLPPNYSLHNTMLYIIIHRTFCHNTSIFKPIKLTSPIGCRYSKFWFFTQLTINIPNNANKNFLCRFGCMCSFLTRTVQLPLKFISRLIKNVFCFYYMYH